MFDYCLFIPYMTVQHNGLHNFKISFYSKTNQMNQFLIFILFWSNNLHVSDGLSVHHQEFKTVHTVTGICQTEITEMGKITSECVYGLK